MKAAVKTGGVTPASWPGHALHPEELRRAGLSLTFPSSFFVQRGWRVFSSTSGSWPGGGGREKRREKNKTKQIYWLCRGSPDTLGHCFTPEKSATPCWKPPSSNCQSGLVCKTLHSEILTESQPGTALTRQPLAPALTPKLCSAAPALLLLLHALPTPRHKVLREPAPAQVGRDAQHRRFSCTALQCKLLASWRGGGWLWARTGCAQGCCPARLGNRRAAVGFRQERAWGRGKMKDCWDKWQD